MDKNSSTEDLCGNKFGERYSTILTDPSFERRLRAYDPNLKLMFDQFTKRWVILVWRGDYRKWQIVMRCQDDFGNPMPVGDHVFQHLTWLRENADKRDKNPNTFYDNLLYQADTFKEKKAKQQAEENQYRIRTDIAQWRKGFNQLHNLPVSDAIAGYPKITYKPKIKGIVCNSEFRETFNKAFEK